MVPARNAVDEVLPLGEKKVPVMKGNIRKMVPALHKGWAEERKFVFFKPPPLPNSDGNYALGERESWIDIVKVYNADMEWLLKLKQHRFWSQVVYHDLTMPAIISFLQEAVPFYTVKKYFLDDEMWRLYRKTYGLIYAIINRLITPKESETEYMSRDFLGNLIYENYIFTISMMFDLCLIYAEDNHLGLQNIISTVFDLQPQYLEDIKETATFCSEVLRAIEYRLDVHYSTGDEPIKLSENSKVQKQPMTLPLFQDIVTHILDTALSLSIFLDVCPLACTQFDDLHFEIRLGKFYEYAVPEMYNKLAYLANKAENRVQYADIKEKLNIIRFELIKSFRSILSSRMNTLMENRDSMTNEEVKKVTEQYLSVLSECLSYKVFMRDYHSTYNVDLDLEIIKQICPEIDSIKFEFLMEAVLSCFDLPTHRRSIFSMHCRNIKPVEKMKESDFGGLLATTNCSNKKKISGVELDSLISEVLDILPHLGDGFVEKCLEYYDYNSEQVINACLENQLPEELCNLDMSLPRIPPEKDEDANIQERYNVFDNDEFDIMKQDVIDTTRVFKGKRKPKFKDVKDLLNDKTHIRQCHETYMKLGLVEENSDPLFNLYDDEYDDTCDDREISVTEVGDEERRPFVVPRVLRSNAEEKLSEDDVSSEDESNTTATGDQFVPNPEKLREEAERRRQLKSDQRTRHFHHGGPPPSRDVVGQSKGQGQDKTVIINRQQKGIHKSFHGNHNRRAGAQRKRQQGLLPS